LRLLARREHSRAELERKLPSGPGEAPELGALLDELEARGWLSEERLAEQAVAGARGRYGPRRVLYALRNKGVSDAVLKRAESALKAQEFEQARAVWSKRFDRAARDVRERAKQARFLEGRGFSAAVIRRVLRANQDD
jgi:regulatory protein